MRILLLIFLIFISSSSFAQSKFEKKLQKDLKKLSKHSGFIDNSLKLYDEKDITDKNNAIVIVFSHGSEDETKLDKCTGRDNVIPAIANLHNKKINGLSIKIYRICNGVRGLTQFDKDRSTSLWKETGNSNGYVELIDNDNIKFIDKWKQVNKQKITLEKINELSKAGFENIVLAGHSAGGWVALNLSSRYPEKIDGAIAFNPAFSGTIKNRKEWPTWESMRTYEVNIISQVSEISALVFAIKGESHETPETLSFLKDINKIHFIDYSNIECKGNKHRIPVWPKKSAECFADYIEKNNYLVNYLSSLKF